MAERFALDRDRFVEIWFTEGRTRVLDERLEESLHDLQRLLDLGPDALSILKRARWETLQAHRLRCDRLFQEIRHYPVISAMLADAAVQGLDGDEANLDSPQTGHLAWILGLAGWPVVVRDNDRGWRVVRCGNFWATPTEEGEFSLERLCRGGFTTVLEAQTLEGLERLIDGSPRDPDREERPVAGAWGPVKSPWTRRSTV